MTQININVNCTATSAISFSNMQVTQVEDRDDQLRVSFNLSGVNTGTIYGRFTSGYEANDGKTETASFPVTEPVTGDGDQYIILSAPNLTAGTTYRFVCYWVAADYSGEHSSGGAGEVYPEGNDMVVSAEITIEEVITAPTDISGVLSVVEGAAAGTNIGQLSANEPNCTFSEISPERAWVTIQSDGRVVVAAGQVAPSAGSYSIGARADNTSSGGGTYDETQSITVGSASSAASLPTVNSTTVTSLSNLYTVVQAFETNFASARTTYGPASGTPVIGLNVNTTSTLDLANYNLSSRIIIRGVGTLSRDSWTPTSTTKVGDVTMQNSENIFLMGMQMVAQSNGTGAANMPVIVKNSTNCGISACVIDLKCPRSEAAAALEPTVSQGIYLNGAEGFELSYNAIAGSRFQMNTRIGSDGTGTGPANVRIEWNVFDQVQHDHIRVQNCNGMNNWYIGYNLAGGIQNNPGFGAHTDFLQVGAGSPTECKDGVGEYNLVLMQLHRGSDSHAPYQFYWFGNGSQSGTTPSSGWTFTQSFTNASGKLFNQGSARNHDATYNTDLAVSDIPASWSGNYTADFACHIATTGTTDYNIVSRKSAGQARGAGPNGIHVECPNSEDGAPASAYSAQDAYVSAPMVRGNTLGDIAPPNSSAPSHWNYAGAGGPRGAYLLMRNLFSATLHEHWKDKGWPVDAMCHIRYDPLNELAGASGTYTTYNSDGSNVS